MARPRSIQVAILGAGPVGLEAALTALDAGWPFTVYESASRPGGLVARWDHVRLFTPWSMNVSARMARHLKAAGVQPPEGENCPTGGELVRDLLEPLAHLPGIEGRIACGTRVLGVAREGLLKQEEIGSARRAEHPFRLLVGGPEGVTTASATLVLDCTGTYETPNAAGDGGIPAPGEDELGDRIERRLPDLAKEWPDWRDRSILLLGSGKSAQTAAREFAALLPTAPRTRVIWAVRHTDPGWGEIPDDPLPERQALADAAKRAARGEVPGIRVETGSTVDRFSVDGQRVRVRLRGAGDRDFVVDKVLSLTGFVPDATLYRQLQVHECYATTAPMELSAQLLGGAAADCLQPPSYGIAALRSPEPNFFILGAKSYGRNSQFLMRTGYDQVDQVAAAYQD